MFDNKYEIIEIIARGGMAEVFKARTKGAAGFEKLVAIKRLHPHLSEDHEMVAMLKDEARLVSNMVHPNICQVINFEKLDNTYCMVMEYIHGQALSTIARQAKKNKLKIPLDISLYIIRQALNGLDYAHRMTDPVTGQSLNIIHRDISPQNILVSYNGGVKIIDFGIAKATASLHHTQSGVIKGKFRYMAPEQALGKDLDHRVDIFAIGVVLYELILGHNHSPGATEVELIVKAQTAKFENISNLVADLPLGLDLAIMRALNPDRDKRYPSARMFRKALDTIVQREHLEVSPDALSDYITSLFPDMHTKGSRVELIERSSQNYLMELSPHPITDSSQLSDSRRSASHINRRRKRAAPPPPDNLPVPPAAPLVVPTAPEPEPEEPPPAVLPEVKPKGKTPATTMSARAKRRLERQKKKEARKKKEAEAYTPVNRLEKTEKVKIKKPPIFLPFMARVFTATGRILVNIFYFLLLVVIVLGLWIYTRSDDSSSSIPKQASNRSTAASNTKRCSMGPIELTILSKPSGADIYLDGENIGQKTPLYNAQTEMCYSRPMLVTLKKGNLSANTKVDYPIKGHRVKLALKLTVDGKLTKYKPKSNSSGFRSKTTSKQKGRISKKIVSPNNDPIPPSNKDIIPIGILKITCSKVCNIKIDNKNRGIKKFFQLRARKRPYKVQAFFTDGTKSEVKKIYILRNRTKYAHFTSTK